jgi:hypothetical protein
MAGVLTDVRLGFGPEHVASLNCGNALPSGGCSARWKGERRRRAGWRCSWVRSPGGRGGRTHLLVLEDPYLSPSVTVASWAHAAGRASSNARVKPGGAWASPCCATWARALGAEAQTDRSEPLMRDVHWNDLRTCWRSPTTAARWRRARWASTRRPCSAAWRAGAAHRPVARARDRGLSATEFGRTRRRRGRRAGGGRTGQRLEAAPRGVGVIRVTCRPLVSRLTASGLLDRFSRATGLRVEFVMSDRA